MEAVFEDRFIVFLRQDVGHASRPDHGERMLATCSSYSEARQLQRLLLQDSRSSVIRFVGPSGGGD
jgi:hypothetical protein